MVYEVHDNVRGMRVALKTLNRFSAGRLLRFKREFRTLSGFSHPNVVGLYELVADGDEWFFTMEFIEGCDLISYVQQRDESAAGEAGEAKDAKRVANGGDTTLLELPGADATVPDQDDDERPLEQALAAGRFGARALAAAAAAATADDYGAMHTEDVSTFDVIDEHSSDEPFQLDAMVDQERMTEALVQLARVLHALHQAGIVHCDLKPSNIMVTAEGRVVLIDFGIAAAIRRAHTNPSGRSGAGTPMFMAPEQTRGEPPTVATDWYAFGVILYCMLTGHFPYEGSLVDMVVGKQQSDPQPPSTFTEGIPPELEHLCMQLLARDPAERPGGAAVLAALGVEDEPDDALASFHTTGDDDDRLFVGRERELELLYGDYQSAGVGVMRTVVVDGASGIGKSTLCDQFTRALAEDGGPLVLATRCHERENMAYKAFDGIVDDLTAALGQIPTQQRRALMPDDVALIARLFPVLRRLPECAQAPSVSGSISMRAQAIEALRTLLGRLARQRPLVIRIEDLQWADGESFALLRHLLEPRMAAPILLLLTVRTEAMSGDQNPALMAFIDGLDPQASRRVSLGPLSSSEQTALVRLVSVSCGRRASSVDDSLLRAAGGHPMLLAELARYTERGEDVGELELEDILWQRVVRQPEAARKLVESAAVMGEPAPLLVVAPAAGLSPAQAEQALTLGRAAALIRLTRAGDEPWLDVFHDKVRESVLERLAFEQAQRLHRALAEAIEGWDRSHLAWLARHWAEAGETGQAVTYLVEAAGAAREQLAFEHAARLYRSASDLLASETGDPEMDAQRCRIWLGLAQSLRILDQGDEALSLLASAQVLAERHQRSELLAEIHFLHGNLLFPRGDIQGCLAQHESARAFAEASGSSALEANALGGLGDAHYLRGRILTAYEHYQRCIELCREHGHVNIEAANLSMLGLMSMYRNDLGRALRDGIAAMELAARCGHRRAEINAVITCLGRVWAELGWLDRGQIERARALAQSMGAHRFETHANIILGRILTACGRRLEARAVLERAVAESRARWRTYHGPIALSSLAGVHDDPDARIRLLEEAEELLQGGSSSANNMFFHRDAMEVGLSLGDHERVERHARAMEEYTSPQPLPWSRFYIARARTLSAFARGLDPDRTRRRLERLAELGRLVGFHVATAALERALAGAE